MDNPLIDVVNFLQKSGWPTPVFWLLLAAGIGGSINREGARSPPLKKIPIGYRFDATDVAISHMSCPVISRAPRW